MLKCTACDCTTTPPPHKRCCLPFANASPLGARVLWGGKTLVNCMCDMVFCVCEIGRQPHICISPSQMVKQHACNAPISVLHFTVSQQFTTLKPSNMETQHTWEIVLRHPQNGPNHDPIQIEIQLRDWGWQGIQCTAGWRILSGWLETNSSACPAAYAHAMKISSVGLGAGASSHPL